MASQMWAFHRDVALLCVSLVSTHMNISFAYYKERETICAIVR